MNKPEPAIAADEHELLIAARNGDWNAFYALIGRYDHGLRGLAYRLLEDRHAMDDALQEAYLKAYQALPSLSGDSAFKSWLYRIVYNACLDELRRRRKMRVLPIEAAGRRPDRRPDPGEAVADKLDLAAALTSLTPETRAAVLLVFVDEMDYGSAARILGISRGTLASRLHRGRAYLRRALDGTEGKEL